jgi:hypothetical protein
MALGVVSSEIVKSALVVAEINVVSIIRFGLIIVSNDLIDRDQSIRIWVRQRLKQHTIDQPKNGGIRTDSESEN